MSNKQIIVIGVMAFLATIVYYSFTGGESPEEYSQQINKEREEKNLFMRNDEGSPFYVGKDSASKFTKLNYYPADLTYKAIANLIPIETKKMVVLATSDGVEKRYLEYAYAEFSIDNQKNKLLLLEVVDPGPYRGTLFLAFADATSGDETYGAGRYLDVKKVPGATTVTLDFNKAYNPYCAYSDNFSCPFPPKENILSIPIKAGEKVYH
ncbi:MAG: DUF1684 domain-containing protein [Bacteroidetes bacterium]|nr:DUF1684 domain-containing protein [Bacteroidota bacterium]